MLSDKQTYAEIAHSMIIAGQPLHYRIAGTGSPLVLIHGYATSGYIWQRALPYLVRQHQVIMVDLPGHGRSLLKGAWRLREMAPVLAHWLQELNLPPAALMGTSMGGAVAIHLTAYVPELIKSLILVCSAGLPLYASVPELTARSIRSFLQIERNRSYPLGLVLDALKPRPRLWWESAHEVASSDFRKEIAMLMLPTLIIWGERDLLLPVSLGHELRHAIPHATFVTLPYSGHRPMLTEPVTFSQIVLDFLQDKQC
jgi:pimeloyl-ACP methyl ester carboxylesterase